jgi:adenylate cyclase
MTAKKHKKAGAILSEPPTVGMGGMALAAWLAVAALPLVGLISLLAHRHLDPGWTNPKVHFLLFATVGGLASGLALAASEAARRRGDARVLLMSLAFLATGGFMVLHALGTRGVLFNGDYAGFKVAIPVGLLVASCFAVAAAFIDVNPKFASAVMHRRQWLKVAVVISMALWAVWTLAKFPPLNRPTNEGATGSLLSMLAAIGVVIYGTAAARFWFVFRNRMSLLPASLIACFVLLTEAMVGVAVTGERAWHASWWLWHILIVLAYVLVGFAARRQWHDERFRPLYLETTREHPRQVSVLFSDLASFTSFTERSSPSEVAKMLNALHGMATPLVTRHFGGVVESLTGDGMYVSFNAHGDQPDHAVRAAGAALALQHEVKRMVAEHSHWPRMRVGVNTGDVVIREMGGDGYVAYQLVGDAVNTASRLEGQADVGGILIGAETYSQLPDGTAVEARPGMRVKGKDVEVDAYVLHSLPTGA